MRIRGIALLLAALPAGPALAQTAPAIEEVPPPPECIPGPVDDQTRSGELTVVWIKWQTLAQARAEVEREARPATCIDLLAVKNGLGVRSIPKPIYVFSADSTYVVIALADLGEGNALYLISKEPSQGELVPVLARRPTRQTAVDDTI